MPKLTPLHPGEVLRDSLANGTNDMLIDDR
jgi:hypothetical protein